MEVVENTGKSTEIMPEILHLVFEIFIILSWEVFRYLLNICSHSSNLNKVSTYVTHHGEDVAVAQVLGTKLDKINGWLFKVARRHITEDLGSISKHLNILLNV